MLYIEETIDFRGQRVYQIRNSRGVLIAERRFYECAVEFIADHS